MKCFKNIILSLFVISLIGCSDNKDFSNAFQDKKTSSYVSTISQDVYTMCTYDEDREAYVRIGLLQEEQLDWGDYIIPNPTRSILVDLKEAYPTATLYYNKKKDVILHIPATDGE